MQVKNLPVFGQPASVAPMTAATIVCVSVDGGTVVEDADALRGVGTVEQGMSFSNDPGAAPHGRAVSTVWVGVRAGHDGKDGYFSAVASPQRIDTANATGFRPDNHFADMTRAIRGEVHLAPLTEAQTHRLGHLLRELDISRWDRREEKLCRLWP